MQLFPSAYAATQHRTVELPPSAGTAPPALMRQAHDERRVDMIIGIEKHLFENENHTVREEYRVYRKPFVYNAKTKSQLTKKEVEAYKKIGKDIFHF